MLSNDKQEKERRQAVLFYFVLPINLVVHSEDTWPVPTNLLAYISSLICGHVLSAVRHCAVLYSKSTR